MKRQKMHFADSVLCKYPGHHLCSRERSIKAGDYRYSCNHILSGCHGVSQILQNNVIVYARARKVGVPVGMLEVV